VSGKDRRCRLFPDFLSPDRAVVSSYVARLGSIGRRYQLAGPIDSARAVALGTRRRLIASLPEYKFFRNALRARGPDDRIGRFYS